MIARDVAARVLGLSADIEQQRRVMGAGHYHGRLQALACHVLHLWERVLDVAPPLEEEVLRGRC